jgi:CHAD domain-containing protein
MATTVREVERKYDVDPAFRLPDLGGLPGVSEVDAPHEQELSATYFDTADLRLAAHRITLRRRTGGTDAGWHLKLPAGDGEREEVRLPLGRTVRTPPRGLRLRVEVYLRGARLVPVVGLTTRRTVYRLIGADAEVLAEVADDQVNATDLAGTGGATVTAWREVEVELVGGGRKLLAAAGDLLGRAGATPSRSASKLARALAASAPGQPEAGRRNVGQEPGQPEAGQEAGQPETGRHDAGQEPGQPEAGHEAGQPETGRHDAGQEPGQPEAGQPEAGQPEAGQPEAGQPEAGQRGPRPQAGSAAAVVLAHVAEQVAVLQYWDPRVRADEPDAVHQMRVTTRRLRSTLATFRPLFDRSVTEPVRAELKWLGTVLGTARDAEVIGDRLLAAVRAEPPELVLGPVAARVRTTSTARHRDAMAAVLAALSDRRYYDLLDALDALLAEPPLTERAADPAKRVLRKRTMAAWRRARRAAEAVPAGPDAGRDAALHEVRKAAKRARYAADTARPVLGKPARSFARGMKSVQKLLGEHQDTVVIRAELRQIGVQAYLDGENSFSYGRLHALEQARAAGAERAYPALWHAAAARRRRRWLKG